MTVAEYNLCVEKFSDGIYRFILKNLKNYEGARDIVQETYAKLWMRYNEVNFEKVKSYLYTTAYHTMIDMIRREKHTIEIEDAIQVTDTGNKNYSDLKEILDGALDKLPENQRSSILLRDYEGYSYKEIEEITGLNESQVKVYIYRARRFLMEYIGSMESVL